MDWIIPIFEKMPWFAWVAIVAIIGGTVSGLVRGRQRHEERMAMIKHGLMPPEDREK